MKTSPTTTRGVRRTLAVTAAGALALALTPAQAFAAHGEICPPPGETASDRFDDDDGNTHEDNIDCLVAYGIAEGFPDGSYGPDVAITRAQMATFIAEYVETATGSPLAEGNDVFSDDEGNVHEANINAIANAGIVSGDGQGDYNPGNRVTRDQMATFVANATEEVLGTDLAEGSDAFTDDEGNVHEANINRLANADIVGGVGGNLYAPNRVVNRDQMATFVVNGAAYLYTQDQWAPVPLTGDATAAPATQQPELTDVAIAEQGPSTTQVRYTFDESVIGQTPDPASFHLYTADSRSKDGQSAFVENGQDDSVLVTFNVNESAIDDYSLATVDFGAVQDLESNSNPEGAFGLKKVVTPGGQTTEPDLTALGEFDVTTNEVDFVFDEEVSAINNDTGFQLVDVDGDVLTSTSAVVDQESENVVHVTFSDIDTTTEGETARGVVLADTVDDGDVNDTDAGDEDEVGNALQIVELAQGGNTDEPDLVSITLDEADEEVLYTFDEPVELSSATTPTIPGAPLPGPENFRIYDRNGSETVGTNATRSSSDANTVVVEYTGDQIAEAIGASVQAGAVNGTTGTSNRANDPDELPTEGTSIDAGRTIAPDLLEVDKVANPGNTSERRVAFTFDEDVNEAAATTGGDPATPDATDFFIYDVDGERVPGVTAEVDSTDSRIVYVTFGTDNDRNIEDAVLGTVDNDAVIDDGGMTNPEGARNFG